MTTSKKIVEEAPAWLKTFVEIAAEAYECSSGLGWRWSRSTDDMTAEKGDLFEVFIYPRLIEVDGEALAPSDVFVDLNAILDLFEAHENVDLASISMQFSCSDDIDHLAVEGSVDGHDVWLRLLHVPPEDEVASMRMGDCGFLEPIPERAQGHHVEAGNHMQAAVDRGRARDRETHDLAMELARAWKTERRAPSELLDRLEKLLPEDVPS